MDEDIDKVEWHMKRGAVMRAMAEAAMCKESGNILLQMAQDYERLSDPREGCLL